MGDMLRRAKIASRKLRDNPDMAEYYNNGTLLTERLRKAYQSLTYNNPCLAKELLFNAWTAGINNPQFKIGSSNHCNAIRDYSPSVGLDIFCTLPKGHEGEHEW